MKQLCISALIAVFTSPVFAAEAVSPYVGIQGQKVTWEQGPFNDGFRADVDAGGVIAGVAIDRYFSVEGRYSAGVDGETIGGVDVDLDRTYGFYVRGAMPTQYMFSPYLIAGYTNTRLEFDGESAADSEDDGSYGGGITFSLEGPLTLDAEWIQYINKEGFDVDSFNLGLNYRF